MQYKHKGTKTIIDVVSPIVSKDWEPVGKTSGYDKSMTKDEIIKKLIELKVAYKPEYTKAVLQSLLDKATGDKLGDGDDEDS